MLSFKDLIGKPYTKEHDCNWLASTVTHRLGTQFPDVVTPPTDEERAKCFQENIFRYSTKIEKPSPGCIAIFKVPKKEPDHEGGDGQVRYVWHCGIILDNKRMITTTEKLGVHIVNMWIDYSTWRAWRMWLQGYYEVDLEKAI